MQGLMQDFPLTLPHFFDRAKYLFPEKEIVTATATGIERTDYDEGNAEASCQLDTKWFTFSIPE